MDRAELASELAAVNCDRKELEKALDRKIRDDFERDRDQAEWARVWADMLAKYGSMMLALPPFRAWQESRFGGSPRTRWKRNCKK